MLSKACVVGAYQRKLEELAALPEMELLVVVPPYWQEEVRQIQLERLHTQGYQLEVEPIRFNGHFHFFYFPGLSRHLRAFQPDIVHLDEEPYNFASWHALRLARHAGAHTLFFTWQNLHRQYPPPFRWMEQYCLDHTDRAIAGNAEAVDVLRQKGFHKPIDVIPQFGVDPDIFRPAFPLSKGEGVFRIGYVGRLVEQKGILDLLEATAGLQEVQLTLVGAGPLRGAIEARAMALNIVDRLEIIPGVPSRQMPDIYNRFDALVLPSLTRPNWKEQFGRAMVEAMACQVPVIGSDSGEIPNVIGDAGIIFHEGDVDALRLQLAKLQTSPELRRQLGFQGRARVLERFTQSRIAEETHQVYRELLATSR